MSLGLSSEWEVATAKYVGVNKLIREILIKITPKCWSHGVHRALSPKTSVKQASTSPFFFSRYVNTSNTHITFKIEKHGPKERTLCVSKNVTLPSWVKVTMFLVSSIATVIWFYSDYCCFIGGREGGRGGKMARIGNDHMLLVYCNFIMSISFLHFSWLNFKTLNRFDKE